MKIIGKAIVLSLLAMVLTSCSAFAPLPTETPAPINTILPILTNAPEPTITPTETLTPTKTANPYNLVDTQYGKQLISEKYGFTITLPSNIDVQTTYPANDGLISGYLPERHLADGGDIIAWFGARVENQTDSCHSKLIDSADIPVKVEQVTLSGISYTKVFTPNLYGNYQQDIEYMTYGTDFCVHFSLSLQTYYFDQGDAQPGNMLPYREHELDHIVSTFRWIKP